MKPEIHAESSAKKRGGITSDYLPLHQLMDSSKAVIPDNRHRSLLHHSFGIFLLEKIFGKDFSLLERLAQKHGWTEEELSDILMWKEHCVNYGTALLNSDGKQVSVRDIGEQHCLEDFANIFIPSPQDYIEGMEFKDWMNNGAGIPPSHAKVNEKRLSKFKQGNWNVD